MFGRICSFLSLCQGRGVLRASRLFRDNFEPETHCRHLGFYISSAPLCVHLTKRRRPWTGLEKLGVRVTSGVSQEDMHTHDSRLTKIARGLQTVLPSCVNLRILALDNVTPRLDEEGKSVIGLDISALCGLPNLEKLYIAENRHDFSPDYRRGQSKGLLGLSSLASVTTLKVLQVQVIPINRALCQAIACLTQLTTLILRPFRPLPLRGPTAIPREGNSTHYRPINAGTVSALAPLKNLQRLVLQTYSPLGVPESPEAATAVSRCLHLESLRQLDTDLPLLPEDKEMLQSRMPELQIRVQPARRRFSAMHEYRFDLPELLEFKTCFVDADLRRIRTVLVPAAYYVATMLGPDGAELEY